MNHKTTTRLELHYYLEEKNLHVIDAFVRNECEKELLALVKFISNEFSVDLSVVSEVPKDGGFIELWTFIGENSNQIGLIISIVALISSRIPTEDRELIDLQKENLKIDNQIKKAELTKLLNNSTDQTAPDVAVKIAEHLKRDPKVIWHKSNFYKKLLADKTIDSVSFTGFDDYMNITVPEKIVHRSMFSSFIVTSNEFAPLIDEDAHIDIISPVLTSGNFHWKGYYKGDILSFQMKDEDFKNSVDSKIIQYSNGIAIKCVLQQNRRIDDNGIIYVTFSKVLTVLEVIESNNKIETPQGQRYIKAKTTNPSQSRFDF